VRNICHNSVQNISPSDVLHKTTEIKTNKRAKSKLQQIQRSFLIFITKAYKRVSHDALSANAGIMPIKQAMHLNKDIQL